MDVTLIALKFCLWVMKLLPYMGLKILFVENIAKPVQIFNLTTMVINLAGFMHIIKEADLQILIFNG